MGKKCKARYHRWRKCMKNKRCRAHWLRHRRCMKNKRCRARWLRHRRCMRNRRCKARYLKRIRHLRCMRNRHCKARWLRSIKKRRGRTNRSKPTFYQHCNFRGYKRSLTRSTHWVRRNHIKNDDLSSIVVPRGWVVTVYQHAHYRGARMTIRGPKKVSCLVRNKMNKRRTWNDQISSIRVHRARKRRRRRRHFRHLGHLQPGNVVALKGGRSGKYCADEGHRIRCNRKWVRSWEKFRVVRAGRNHIALRGGRHHRYCADDRHGVRCNRRWVRSWPKFHVVVVKRGRRRL